MRRAAAGRLRDRRAQRTRDDDPRSNGRADLLVHEPQGRRTAAVCGRGASAAPGEIPLVVLPRGPALLSVKARRGAAEATLRITRRSVIKGTLLRPGARIVGAARVVRSAGTRTIRVPLDRKRMRRMRQRGLERVMLTLRIAVTARRGGATHVFRHRVLVRL